MISKYFPLASVLVMTLLSLSSCLNSSNDNVEYSPDAQIYAFSISSKTDTAALLSATQFTIDQINGRIFNKKPLPYQFHVDSVLLSIRGASTYSPFAQVTLTLHPDSTFLWRASDSVAVNRLQRITTTAPDGKSTRTYTFELHIYQKDPYTLTWENLKTNYLPVAPLSQQTVALGERLITYYRTVDRIEAVCTPTDDGVEWSSLNIQGLPTATDLSTLTVSDKGIFVLDCTSNTVYHSPDGIVWSAVSAPYSVKAIYGTLPATVGGALLVAIDHDNSLRFAETNDFTQVVMRNKVPDNIPVRDFAATKVDNPTSFSVKYILLAGGTTADNIPSNQIWILQKKEGVISSILSRVPSSLTLQGNSLFYYDNKPYLMAASAGKNLLYFSDNFGLDWQEAEENQSFPASFPKRTHASVLTDTKNHIWIFGGISSDQAQITDVWRGCLNKFTGM